MPRPRPNRLLNRVSIVCCLSFRAIFPKRQRSREHLLLISVETVVSCIYKINPRGHRSRSLYMLHAVLLKRLTAERQHTTFRRTLLHRCTPHSHPLASLRFSGVDPSRLSKASRRFKKYQASLHQKVAKCFRLMALSGSASLGGRHQC